MEKIVRTRIAPSPTGFPHLGTIYQVLFDYAFAHKYGGQFIVRLEDTDRVRFVPGGEEVIYKMLKWFNLEGDEDPVKGGPYAPYRQSERLSIYKPYVDELISKGYAYPCFCTKERLEIMRKQQEEAHQPPMYDRHCRNLSNDEVASKLAAGLSHVVRMKIPDGEIIAFEDLLLGRVEFRSELIDDQVLLKADGYPTYHLAVVVDDHLMNISHIFRGREWIPSTPKHVLLYRFFGWTMPEHIHLPLVLNSEGKGKLSKRHGHASVDYYKQKGYLPEAVLNYLSNIVWNNPEGKEIYNFDEFIRLFEVKDVTSQGAKFDLKKLDWVNGQWVRNMLDIELTKRLTAHDEKEVAYSKYRKEQIALVLPLVKDRINLLSEFDDLVLFFFEEIEAVLKNDLRKKNVEIDSVEHDFSDRELADYWRALLLGKNKDASLSLKMIEKALDIFQITESWEHTLLEKLMRELLTINEWKIGDFFMVLRVAVTGRSATPPLFETMEILGREVCLKRLTAALKVINY